MYFDVEISLGSHRALPRPATNTRSGMRPGGYCRGRARLTEHTDVLGLRLPAVRRNGLVKLDLVAVGKPFQPFRE